jgi:hypothetical protein
MPYEVTSQGHPSATTSPQPTRDPDAERGAGRAFRHEANMLPRIGVAIRTQKAGMPAHRAWSQGPAMRADKDPIGKTGSLTVAVRSGNADPAAIGVNKTNWGIAGVGAEPAADATAGTQSKLFLIGGIAALAAFFLFRRKATRSA